MCSVVGFIPSGQRCKTCPTGRGTDLKSAQVFSQHENNSTSSYGLMNACLYGDVAQLDRALDTDQPEGLRVRGFPSPPKIVRLFPTPLYKGSCTGK